MATMEAIRIHQFGPPDVLHEEAVARPEPQAGEMLVEVAAASVNPVDFKMRSGEYPSAKAENLPLILGRDLSGTVDRVGAGFDAFAPGDEVFAFLGRDRGAYAQYVVVKPEEAAKKPSNLSHVEAASLPLAGLTAWQGLFDHGGLRAGQRVLIHGGAGGVGHLAIQFAKVAGATIITTASDADKEFLQGLGADMVIDHKRQRFEDVLGDQPVDLVFDLVGGETQARSWKLVRTGGILVSTLGQPDAKAAEDHGVRAAGYMAAPDSRELAEIARLVESGEVVPHVARIYPFAEAAKAHEQLERQHVQGKIVLRAA